jgi:PTS system nitrogen regulatory IIA component
MNQIARLLTVDNIVVALELSNKKSVFEHVGLVLEKHHGIPVAAVFDALIAREKLGSTALGLGVAIPHGRVKGLKEVSACFVRLATAIDFDAPDGKPVKLIFALLVPEAANSKHLQLVAELAQMFSDQTFREKLATAPDANALLEAFSGWAGQ